MLNDVTFGQYYPVRSFVHNMDPRAKIVFVIAYIVAIFLADNFFGLAAVTLFLLVAVFLSRVPLGRVLRSVKMILFLVIFTAVLNLFFYTGESAYEPLLQWWIVSVTWESIVNTIFLAVRLFLLVLGTSLLTLTTTPVSLTDGIESLLKPLIFIKVPVHELALIMSIALRFIPILIDETNRIISAQKARGADFDTGGLIKRAKELSTSEEWNKTTEEMNDLMLQWKAAGTAGKETDDALWEEFRNARQTFFDRRRDHWKNLREKFDSARKIKQDLIQQAAALEDSRLAQPCARRGRRSAARLPGHLPHRE